MAKGIVVKVWNIKDGSQGRGAGAQILSSIDYITNSEKCDETLSAGVGQIGRELKYVTNDVKTLEGLYVGCRNISDISNATNEMMQVKEFHGKFGGRVALHGIVSLDEEESEKKNAGKLMMLMNDLLEEVFPDQQAVYAVHTNTENLHIHFILNTVGLSGKKIHMDASFMRTVLEPAVNRLAEKYGFTKNVEWEKEKTVDKMTFPERIIHLKEAVDLAIERSDDFEGFLKDLKKQGLTVNFGKHLSLKEEGMTRPVRSSRLGSMYTAQKIRDRILTKKEDLVRSEVTDHMGTKAVPMAAFVRTSPLVRYKDMSEEEKEKAIRLLKLGRNPWRERTESNWAMQRMADEFNRTADVYEIIRAYAPKSLNAQDALDEIVSRQKELAKEKKEVKERLKEYRPIIRIYEEMKKYARKAYLYEFAGCDEYMSDYLEYKKLSERLEKGYSKTVLEVADFVNDAEGQILYATAQSKELSDEYKTILRFKENELKEKVLDNISLYEAIGLTEARDRARRAGVFESSIRYIAADGCDGAFIRVVITPDVIDGKRTEKAVLTVFDGNGRQLREVSSEDMTIKDFNKEVSELKAEFGLYRCHVFDGKERTQSFVDKQKEEKNKKISHTFSD